MAERPVVVAFRVKFGQRARRVVRVRRIAFERRVQHADVVVTGHRIRIADREIVDNGLVLKLCPCSATSNSGSLWVSALRWPNTVTLSGSVSFFVISLSASWLPPRTNARMPALRRRPICWPKKMPVLWSFQSPSYRSPAITRNATSSSIARSTSCRSASRDALRNCDRRVGIRAQAMQRAVKVYVCRVDELHEDSFDS